MIVIAVFNLLDCIQQKTGAADYLLFVAPFLLCSVALYFVKGYKVNAALYAIAGIVIILTGSKGNLSGATLVIFSIYIFNTFTSNMILLGLCMAAIAFRYIFMDWTASDALAIFVGHAFIFSIYFLLIHPKQPQKSVISRVDDVTIGIVQYLHDGMRIKDIAEKVYLSTDAVYHRLRRARQRYGCDSNIKLCAEFDRLGFLIQKNDDA
jgi:hypothetical protein